MAKEPVVTFTSAPGHELDKVKETFEELRSAPFCLSMGKRGIQLDSSEFGTLADYLYYECGWEPFDIIRDLDHYEGWDDHEWAPPNL